MMPCPDPLGPESPVFCPPAPASPPKPLLHAGPAMPAASGLDLVPLWTQWHGVGAYTRPHEVAPGLARPLSADPNTLPVPAGQAHACLGPPQGCSLCPGSPSTWAHGSLPPLLPALAQESLFVPHVDAQTPRGLCQASGPREGMKVGRGREVGRPCAEISALTGRDQGARSLPPSPHAPRLREDRPDRTPLPRLPAPTRARARLSHGSTVLAVRPRPMRRRPPGARQAARVVTPSLPGRPSPARCPSPAPRRSFPPKHLGHVIYPFNTHDLPPSLPVSVTGVPLELAHGVLST